MVECITSSQALAILNENGSTIRNMWYFLETLEKNYVNGITVASIQRKFYVVERRT